MARFLKIFLSVIVLLIALAVAIPFCVPTDKIKDEVLAQIEARTGRKITIEHVSFSIFPVLGLSAQGASVSNPGWAEGNMAEIKTLNIGLELLPLLHGEYRLKELTLEQPVIALIKDRDMANWELSAAPPATKTAVTVEQAQQDARNGVRPRMALADLHLDKITITDGTVTYKDGNKVQTISGLNLSVKAPDFNGDADADVSMLYEGKKLEAKLTVDKLLLLATGGTAGVHMKMDYGAWGFTWEGTAALPHGGAPTLTGKIDIPSLNTADFSQESEGGDHSGAAQRTPAARSEGASRWSDAHLDLSGLARANANMTVSIGKLTLPKTTLDNIVVTLRLNGGNLQVQADPIKAYGGSIDLLANIRSGGAVGLTLSVRQAEAEPLLHDFAGFDRLSGTIDMQTKLAANGGSERALINSLSGTGAIGFKNGKLKGVNLAGLIRAGLIRNVTGEQQSEDSSTDFTELSMSYTIARGIVATHDIKLASPLLRVSGEGTIDLPGWQDNLLIKPMLVASLQGQGGKDASGIIVPVKVEGPLDHPRYQPDLQAALRDNLADPSKLKNDVKNLKKSLLNGGGLQNLLR